MVYCQLQINSCNIQLLLDAQTKQLCSTMSAADIKHFCAVLQWGGGGGGVLTGLYDWKFNMLNILLPI